MIKPDGTHSEQNIADGDLGRVIGGSLTLVNRGRYADWLNKNLVLYADDAFLMKQLPRNDIVERVALALGFGVNLTWGLCGTLVFAVTDGAGTHKSLSDREIASLNGMCTEAKNADFDETDEQMIQRIRSAIVEPTGRHSSSSSTTTKKRTATPKKGGGIEKKSKRPRRK